MPSTRLNLLIILQDLQYVAHQASLTITTARPSTSTKKNTTDLVTETDKAVEHAISFFLSTKYPSYKFMGEESYKDGDALTDEPTFIVDPIDGTTNFVHSFPSVAVSLGLTVGKKPVVGVVFDVFGGIMYSAAHGCGAFVEYFVPPHLNGVIPTQDESEQVGTPKPLAKHALPLKGCETYPNARPLEPLTSLSSALMALEWGSDRSEPDFAIKASLYAKLCRSSAEGGAMVHSVRSLGSAALNFCAVAEGGIDVYWESGCWAWDVAAAWVILEEAGGRIVDPLTVENGGRGEEPTVDGRRYLACRKGVAESVIDEFWEVVGGEIGGMSYGR